MTQTSVDYLWKSLLECGFKEIENVEGFYYKAKEINKEEIKKSWLAAWKDSMINPLEDNYYEPEAEQYYNETYQSK
jgi:hypothetical protein